MTKRIISIIAVLCLVMALLPAAVFADNALTLTKTVIGNTGARIAVSGGSGTISAVSGNTSVATVEVSGSTVTVTGVAGKKGLVPITVTRGGSSAVMEVAIGYTTFSFNGRTLTVYVGSDTNYEVVAIEKASETEYLGTEDTGEMTASTDANGNPTYTVSSGYELSVGIKKKGGTYAFNGSSDYANIVVKKEATKDATLLLDGLNLKSQFTSALTIKKDSTAKVYLNTVAGTSSTLADSAVNNADTYGPTADGGDGSNQYYAESAVIKGKTAANLTIAGKGRLTVTSAAKNGIKVGANGHLTVADGTLTVNAINAALSVENEMLISGGTLDLTTSDGDAIKAADDTDAIGNVYITGGNITVHAADEGILARNAVSISGGTLNISATGDGIKAEDGTATYGDIDISGGDFTIVTTGDGISGFNNDISGGTFNITCANGYTNTSYNGDLETTPSAKCIKAELENTFSGGTFTLSTPDDAIHSDGNITFEGGNFADIRTRDDGVHADQVLTFGIRGADESLLNLRINNSYEGMEGADVVLNSGYSYVCSTDDVINAANKDVSNYHFTINVYGGTHRLYTSGGDGVDSNGGCYFRGGDLEVFAKSGTSNDPLDSEDTLALYNGIVLGCGQNAMQGAPSAGIYVQFSNLSISSGSSIVIKDASGNVLKSTTAYFAGASTTASYIIFSHPALVSGSTYYCYVNGSSSAKTATATGTHVDNTPWVNLDSGNTNVFERVTSMGEGSRYVITNASASTTVYTLGGSSTVSAVSSTLSSVSGGYSFGTLTENNTWYMDAAGHIYNTVGGVNYYLNYTQTSSGWSSSYTLGKTTDVSAATAWEVSASGSAAQIYATATSAGGGGWGGGPGGPGQSTKLYLYYSSGWKITTSSATVYVYAPAVAQAALTGSTYYVAENDEGFGMSDIQAGTSIMYRSSRSGSATNVAWNSSHISYSWEPAFNSAANGTYVMTVCYDGVAFGTVTVRIVGDNQSVIVTFTGDYTGTVELAAGECVTLPTAPAGYYYEFYVNGLEFDPATPITADTTISVVLCTEEVSVLIGDVDCDGKLSFSDISVLYSFIMNAGTLSADGIAAADVDGDGQISATDVSMLYALILNN
ncbi:MAG: carbohydrate-binding domain-containing protein [Clostridia bacterium]|nr:carbohydrate-binding domain-containing protein [Clostridia bacterium]